MVAEISHEGNEPETIIEVYNSDGTELIASVPVPNKAMARFEEEAVAAGATLEEYLKTELVNRFSPGDKLPPPQ